MGFESQCCIHKDVVGVCGCRDVPLSPGIEGIQASVVSVCGGRKEGGTPDSQTSK